MASEVRCVGMGLFLITEEHDMAKKTPTKAQYRAELTERLLEVFEEFDGKAYQIDDATMSRISLGVRLLVATLPR